MDEMDLDLEWLGFETPGLGTPFTKPENPPTHAKRLKRSEAVSDILLEEISSGDDAYVRWLRTVILRTLLHTPAKSHLQCEFGHSMNALSRFMGMCNLEAYCQLHRVTSVNMRLKAVLNQWETRYGTACHFPPDLQRNLDELACQVGLNAREKELLGFAILLQVEPIAARLSAILGGVPGHRIDRILAPMLGWSLEDVDQVLEKSGTLSATGLLQIELQKECSLRRLMGLLTPRFPFEMMKPQQDLRVLLQRFIQPAQETTLSLQDYAHIPKDVQSCTALLAGALAVGHAGINILIWGPPGAGKTEFAKLLAAQLHVQLLEVCPHNGNGDTVSASQRIRNFKVAQKFYADNPCLLMFDECEEIFTPRFMPLAEDEDSALPRKSWINKTLETNDIPTIWIANSVECFDAAYLRRFSICMEMPVPPLVQRQKMITQALGHAISDEAQARIANHSDMTPGLFSKAAEVLALMADTPEPLAPYERDAQVIHLLNSALKAQGKAGIEEERNKKDWHGHFQLCWLNADVDLQLLCNGLRKARSGRLLITGAPSTGKTAFGQWLASELDMPHLAYKASDLLGPYIGETEQKIAGAFATARELNALLQLDEVDTFLQERQSATRHWETTQVNQMLTELDNHDGLFIASTNLLERLDKASLRRFDMTLHFGPLKTEMARQMFISTCERLGLGGADVVTPSRLAALGPLTPGDFEQVLRRGRLIILDSPEQVLQALRSALDQKRPATQRPVGFLAVA